MNDKKLLMFEWTCWVIQVKQTAMYESYGIEPICSFDSAELFWAYFKKLPSLPDLKHGGIGLFKKNIRPAWEDPANRHGFNVIVRDVEWNKER